MKKLRSLTILVLVCVMLASLVGCGGTTGPSDETGSPVGSEAPASVSGDDVGEATQPQQGGTLTIASTTASFIEPVGWHIHTTTSIGSTWWLNPVQEYLIQGDFLNKGPRGTGESDFNLNQAEWPAELLTGWILDSWEWSDDPMGVTMVVKQGIKWSANAALGMESRELTADDVANWINSYRTSDKASKINPFTDENCAEVVGDNTVFVSFTQPFASWSWVLGYCLYNNVYPPEQDAVDNFGWENVTGTGPFTIDDYTTGVGTSYIPNPDWWASEIEIDGNTYSAPFIDELNLPILGDISTAMSALMAGQVDIMTAVPITYKETLQTACPDLNMVEGPAGVSINLSFNALSGPCSDREFRRALMIGIDNDAITALVDGGFTGGFPFSRFLGESIYTPIDKLPDDVKVLYEYDPEEATQMIADLGYAGETIKLSYANTDQNIVSIAEVLENQWSQLGITVELNLIDSAVQASYSTGDGSNWEDVFLYSGANSKTSRGIENERSKPYLPCYTDEEFNNMMDEMMADPDPARRDEIMKEAAVYFMGNVEEFGLVETSTLTCWWPWVKNYYGETDSGGSGNIAIIAAYSWIDEDIKSSMGF